MKDFAITEHYSMYNLTVSEDYPHLVLPNRNFLCRNPYLVSRLTLTTDRILEPIYSYYQKKVIVTSAFRYLLLNSSVGGSKYSQHPKAEAIDFTVENENMLDVFNYIEYNLLGLEWNQLIYYPKMNIIHISMPTKTNNMRTKIKI